MAMEDEYISHRIYNHQNEFTADTPLSDQIISWFTVGM